MPPLGSSFSKYSSARAVDAKGVINNAEIMEVAQQWANDVLVWVGFGTLAGLLAKAIMPGRDPGGTVATLLMGIGGTVMGCGALSFFYRGNRITPISPLGFIVATAGAFTILCFYRMLAGYWFVEGDVVTRRLALRRRSRGRRYHDAHYE